MIEAKSFIIHAEESESEIKSDVNPNFDSVSSSDSDDDSEYGFGGYEYRYCKTFIRKKDIDINDSQDKPIDYPANAEIKQLFFQLFSHFLR